LPPAADCSCCDIRRDKDVTEVMEGWERAIDKTFDLKDWC
jgi:hypothetical protein